MFPQFGKVVSPKNNLNKNGHLYELVRHLHLYKIWTPEIFFRELITG